MIISEHKATKKRNFFSFLGRYYIGSSVRREEEGEPEFNSKGKGKGEGNGGRENRTIGFSSMLTIKDVYRNSPPKAKSIDNSREY